MLDKPKVLRALEHISSDLFIDISQELDEARRLWKQIVADDLFEHYVHTTPHSISLVHWMHKLGGLQDVQSFKDKAHTIVGVDGSQIYPDRHQGTTCFLVNTGSVILHYDAQHSYVTFATDPRVFASADEGFAGCPIDFVNCKREEFEFLKGLEITQALKTTNAKNLPLLLLFDGSLIFWHLESKDEELRMVFLNKYCATLQELAQNQILYAGYISVPKSKDLVNLIRCGKSKYEKVPLNTESFEHVLDVHVAGFYLKPFTRSTIFKHQSALSMLYPCAIRPCFFYLHVGAEIVRVEIPAWIAQDQVKTDLVASMILDNTSKGNGYPVVLAEAHEQAVVKGADRDFFYHLIQKIGLARNKAVSLSPKSSKKKCIGV